MTQVGRYSHNNAHGKQGDVSALLLVMWLESGTATVYERPTYCVIFSRNIVD
jgi:hypothetical protein